MDFFTYDTWFSSETFKKLEIILEPFQFQVFGMGFLVALTMLSSFEGNKKHKIHYLVFWNFIVYIYFDYPCS